MNPKTMRRALAALTLAACSTAALAASVAPVAAEHGMVVTAQHLATRVGVDVLKDGGNAVDAAVAVGYALAVVYPAAGNLGGGGFMTIRLADGRTRFIDFREKAPLGARADMYLDAAGNLVPGLSTRGWLSAGVPGSVAGLELARERYGTMKRAALLAPAVHYAAQGFVLDAGDAATFAVATADFRTSRARCAASPPTGRPASTAERPLPRSSPPAAPATGCSRRPTWTSTAPSSVRRSSATIAAPP